MGKHSHPQAEGDTNEWKYMMAFKNPDAQKKQRKIKWEKAREMVFKGIMTSSTYNYTSHEHRSKLHKAITKILQKMADEKGKIPKYKGGRFVKKVSFLHCRSPLARKASKNDCWSQAGSTRALNPETSSLCTSTSSLSSSVMKKAWVCS